MVPDNGDKDSQQSVIGAAKDKELAKKLMAAWLSVSKRMAEGSMSETAWVVGLMMGISLMRSHPELALSVHERFQGEDMHLFQVSTMDQVIELFATIPSGQVID